MTKPFCLLTYLWLSGSYLSALAQTITTTTLSNRAVCPGATLDVSFSVSGTFGADNTFTVQIASDNGAFANVPTGSLTKGTLQNTVTATIPATTVAGTSYRVRVVASDPAVQGTVSTTPLTVKTLPGAPTLPLQLIAPNSYQYTFCQNDKSVTLAEVTGPVPANYRVQYDYGSDPTPTVQRTTSAPTITTDKPIKLTYNLRFVVIDATLGCNPGNDAVAFLQAEVKPRPGVPVVPNPALTYCQNSSAPALSANSNVPNASLIWYDAADKLLSTTNAPVPPTGQTGIQTYQVAQSADRCEGPKVPITVSIQSTPAPTISQTRLELCKGSTAQPLTASGTNLRWTDPTGASSAAAPTPSTSEVTKNAAGDAYSVTQTGANGCVSPATTVRVFVLGPPTLALSGSTTITVGTTAVLTLTFTGNGPYNYRLTNGLTSTATKDTTLRVSPTVTTVYQVAEVSNRCGTGLPISPATITVAAPTIRTLPLSNSIVCAGSALTGSFQTTGTFNAGNSFRLRVARVESGTAGAYTELLNQSAGSGQVTGTLPATLAAGTYALAIVSTSPDITAANTFTPITIAVRALASASVTASSTTVLSGGSMQLRVAFGGEGPWTFSYRDSTDVPGPVQMVNTNANPHAVDLRPVRTAIYRLTALSNACGSAPTLPAALRVTVSPLLATEPSGAWVTVYPIPASAALTVSLTHPLPTPATLDLLDTTGRTTHSQQTTQAITTLSLRGQPAGVYVLRVRVGSQATTRRVVIE